MALILWNDSSRLNIKVWLFSTLKGEGELLGPTTWPHSLPVVDWPSGTTSQGESVPAKFGSDLRDNHFLSPAQLNREDCSVRKRQGPRRSQEGRHLRILRDPLAESFPEAQLLPNLGGSQWAPIMKSIKSPSLNISRLVQVGFL